VDAGEAAGFGGVPFGAGFDRDAARAQTREQVVEPNHPEVEHERLGGRQIVGGRGERSVDPRSGGGVPRPLIDHAGPAAVAPAADADAEVGLVPRRQRVGVVRPEKQPADAGDAHHC